MSGFVFHPDALADLDEIWEFIAADNLSAADGVLEEIYEAIRALVPFPQVGHGRTDLTSRPLRFQPVRDFLIAYAPDEKPLLVIAVLHGRRNPDSSPQYFAKGIKSQLREIGRVARINQFDRPARVIRKYSPRAVTTDPGQDGRRGGWGL
jgi:toxin ParE1/3/4